MNDTNQNPVVSHNSSSNTTEEAQEAPKKAKLGELYEFLTGPYYVLLIVGIISALAGGKYIYPQNQQFLLIPD